MSKQTKIFLFVTAVIILLLLAPLQLMSIPESKTYNLFIYAIILFVATAIITLFTSSENRAEGKPIEDAYENSDIVYQITESQLTTFKKHFKIVSANKENIYFVFFAIAFSFMAIILILFGYNIFLTITVLLIYLAYCWYIKDFSRPESYRSSAGDLLTVGLSEQQAIVGSIIHNWSKPDSKIDDVVLRKLNNDLYYLAVYYIDYVVVWHKQSKTSIVLSATGIKDAEKERKDISARIPVPASEVEKVQPIVEALLARKNSTSIR
jgi:hypothetical protein